MRSSNLWQLNYIASLLSLNEWRRETSSFFPNLFAYLLTILPLVSNHYDFGHANLRQGTFKSFCFVVNQCNITYHDSVVPAKIKRVLLNVERGEKSTFFLIISHLFFLSFSPLSIFEIKINGSPAPSPSSPLACYCFCFIFVGCKSHSIMI